MWLCKDSYKHSSPIVTSLRWKSDEISHILCRTMQCTEPTSRITSSANSSGTIGRIIVNTAIEKGRSSRQSISLLLLPVFAPCRHTASGLYGCERSPPLSCVARSLACLIGSAIFSRRRRRLFLSWRQAGKGGEWPQEHKDYAEPDRGPGRCSSSTLEGLGHSAGREPTPPVPLSPVISWASSESRRCGWCEQLTCDRQWCSPHG